MERMMRRLQGQGGISLVTLLQNDVDWEAYHNAPVFKKVLHTLQSIIIYGNLLFRLFGFSTGSRTRFEKSSIILSLMRIFVLIKKH